jgi:hypothetical protein
MSDSEPDIDIEKLLKDVELFGNHLILVHYRALFACLAVCEHFGVFPSAESIDLVSRICHSCIGYHVSEQLLLWFSSYLMIPWWILCKLKMSHLSSKI